MLARVLQRGAAGARSRRAAKRLKGCPKQGAEDGLDDGKRPWDGRVSLESFSVYDMTAFLSEWRGVVMMQERRCFLRPPPPATSFFGILLYTLFIGKMSGT